jgi:hypothetical protein
MVEVKLLNKNLLQTHLQAVIRPLAVTRKTQVRMHPMELKMIKNLKMIKKPKTAKKRQETIQLINQERLEEITNQERLELMINLKTRVEIQVNQLTKNLMKSQT